MSVFFDYFSAPSDEVAAAVIQQGPRLHGLDVVEQTGIEPVVVLARLQGLLTGAAYDDVIADPRSGKDVALLNGGEILVLSVPDVMKDALARADDETLAEVAVPLSQVEEFWGLGDPAELTPVLHDLARLARRAHEREDRLYCWVCV